MPQGLLGDAQVAAGRPQRLRPEPVPGPVQRHPGHAVPAPKALCRVVLAGSVPAGAVSRLADDAHEFIWSRHHLLLDGWSVSLVLKEVFVCYAAFRQGREPPLEQPRPYRDYLAWLQQQDVARAESFWRATMSGFRAPTPLGVDRAPVRPPGQEQYGDQWLHLPTELTAALHTLARAQRLTMNTLFQGAWALMLFGACSALSWLGSIWPEGRLSRWFRHSVFARLLQLIGCAVGRRLHFASVVHFQSSDHVAARPIFSGW